MLLKKLGTAASVMAAIGMVLPMTVGFTSQTGNSSSAVSGVQHQQVYQAKVSETADDLVNDIQNAKINKYQTMIEMKIQEAKQPSASHEVATKQAKASKTAIHKVKQPVVKAEKSVKETKKAAAVKDTSAAKPEGTAEKEIAAPVKKTSVVKKTVKPAKAARTDSETAETKAAASPAVQKQVSAAPKAVKPQTTVTPEAEQAETPTATEKNHSSAAPKQQTYQAPQPSTATARPTSASAAQSTNGSSATFTLTAYSLKGNTATGINLTANPNAKVIAVDPSVIPLGSTVTIPGLGTFTAADTGGAIQGHRIDVHMPSTQAALNFGVRTMQVSVNH